MRCRRLEATKMTNHIVKKPMAGALHVVTNSVRQSRNLFNEIKQYTLLNMTNNEADMTPFSCQLHAISVRSSSTFSCVVCLSLSVVLCKFCVTGFLFHDSIVTRFDRCWWVCMCVSFVLISWMLQQAIANRFCSKLDRVLLSPVVHSNLLGAFALTFSGNYFRLSLTNPRITRFDPLYILCFVLWFVLGPLKGMALFYLGGITFLRRLRAVVRMNYFENNMYSWLFQQHGTKIFV